MDEQCQAQLRVLAPECLEMRDDTVGIRRFECVGTGADAQGRIFRVSELAESIDINGVLPSCC